MVAQSYFLEKLLHANMQKDTESLKMYQLIGLQFVQLPPRIDCLTAG